ncbi:MAG: TIGR03619 family F420-dependent LLM class oxidoreductase [Burkholderiales bacterium]
MKFGFSIPTRGPLADPETIVALAQRGEALGFSIIAIPDHIVIPKRIAAPYPYSADGKMAQADFGNCLDPLALMAYLAAATKTIRLLTSIMVVPHRPAVMTAKMLATIDVMSGGRITVGCGAGWLPEEFAAIGAPPFAERGKVTDEYLAIFKKLWTEDDPRHDGPYASFADISFLPKPIQKPHPPLWIGGESPPAMRRAARLGNGWYPIGRNPAHPLDTLERYRDGVERLRGEAERIGRDPATLDLAYWAMWNHEAPTRHLLSGGTNAVADDIGELERIGLKHCLFNLVRASRSESLDAMDAFAEKLIRP